MTLELLDKAQKLQEEIKATVSVGALLEQTIEWYREDDRPSKRFLRFLNCKRSNGGPMEARVLIFRDLGSPIDIPVDLEMLEYLLVFFEKRYKKKQAEFDILGGDPNGRGSAV